MQDTILTGSEKRAGRREWIGLAVLALPTLLVSIDVSVLFLALPHLSADLGADSTQQLWILDVYGFMLAGFLVTMGTLGDRIGRRRLLLIGAAAFGVASVIAAYSVSAEMLIVARAALGIAGATLMPSTLALIGNMFHDARQRGLAIGVWVVCVLSGMALGPLVGGLLLQVFWWGSVFLLAVPMMVVLLLAAPMLLPEYRDPSAGRLDLASVALSLATILPAIYGIKQLAKEGVSQLSLVTVLALVVGVGFGVLFARRQNRLPNPLLDLRLFRNRAFSAALGVMLLSGLTLGGIFLLLSQYLQLVEGLSPLVAGLWLLPAVATAAIGSLLAPLAARRFRPATVMAGSLTIAITGCLVLTQTNAVSGLVAVVAGFAYFNLGAVPLGALGTELVVGSTPPEKAGSAASLSETASEFGFALGVATLGSLGVAVYRGQIAEVLPTQAGTEVGDSLAAATSGELGATVVDAARGAFTSGLHTVALVSAILLAALGLLGAALLRHVRPSSEAGAQPDPAGPTPGGPDAVTAATPEDPWAGVIEVIRPAGAAETAVQAATTAVAEVAGTAARPMPPVTAVTRPVQTRAGRGLRQLPGDGVLARYGELVLLCDAPAGQDARVAELVDELAAAAAARLGGQQLSRRLVGLLASGGADDYPSLCAFGPAGAGIAVLVHGRAELTLTVRGRQLRLDGRDAVIAVDRVVNEPVDHIRAAVGGNLADLVADRWSQLDSGVVRAGALIFEPGAGGSAGMAGNGAHGPALDTPPAGLVLPPPPVVLLPELVAAGQALSNGAGAVGLPVDRRLIDGEIVGVYCKNNHFNDPRMPYCSVCGIAMAQSNRLPGAAQRPQLGVLLLDDATMLSLTCDHVFGRMPESDAAVIAGKACPVRLTDPLISRVHARVLLDGWEVSIVDAGSANGTFVCAPGESEWTRLPSGGGTVLRPGAAAAFGNRQLSYHSYRNL